MSKFPRNEKAVSRLATPPRFPQSMLSWSRGGRGQARDTLSIGRTWTETFPVLDTNEATVRELIQTLNQSMREGTVWDIQHPYWHRRKGYALGTPLVNGVNQTGDAIVIDGAQPQKVTDPENFSNWSNISVPTLTGSQDDPYGGTRAYLITDDSASNAEGIDEAVVFTGNGSKLITLCVKYAGRATNYMRLRDTTASTNRGTVAFNWNGSILTNVTVFDGSATIFSIEPLQKGWYRTQILIPSIVAANTNRLQLYPCSPSTVSETGSMLVFGAQAFDLTSPISDYYWLRKGDMISIAGCPVVLDVADGCNPNASGQVTIPIHPPIFAGQSPADNTPVIVDPSLIYFKVRVAAVSDFTDMDVPRFIDQGIQVTFREEPQ